MYSESHTPTNQVYIKERNNIMKRILSIVLAVFLLFSVYVNILATDVSLSIDEVSIKHMTRYINASYNGDASITISEPITVFDVNSNSTSGLVYFAISNNSIIGMLTMKYIDGKYYSSYSEPYSELIAIYENNQSFALITYSGELLLKTNAELSILTANANGISLDSAVSNCQNIELTHISDSEILITIYPQTRATIMTRIYDVPFVENYSDNVSGLCWAATVASMSNFYKNTNYSASDIYNICDEAYSGTPAGNDTWYPRAYGELGMTIDMNVSSPALTYSQIYGNLVTYGPIQIGLRRTTASGTYKYHALIISGIQVFQDTIYDPSNYYAIYHFRDSNEINEISCIVDYDAMTDGSLFKYVPPYDESRCYDTWKRTIIVTGY